MGRALWKRAIEDIVTYQSLPSLLSLLSLLLGTKTVCGLVQRPTSNCKPTPKIKQSMANKERQW